MRLYLAAATFLCHAANIAVARQLIYAHVVFRHGARGPSKIYPNDPHQMDYWINGKQQLTEVGMRQQYALGQWLRQRYSGFLSPEFRRKELYARSSNSPRALQSASANLAGLYGLTPPSRRFESALPWRPVPIHAADEDTDLLLKTVSVDCDAFDAIVKPREAAVIRRLDAANADFYRNLTRLTGMKKEMNTEDVTDYVWGPWACELAEGISLPSWADARWGNHPLTVYERVREVKRALRVAPFQDPEAAKLGGGYLLGDILSRSARAADGALAKGDPSKVVIYSGHQSTVLSLIHAMGLDNSDLVPFAGALGIELWRGDDGDKELEVWYRNDTRGQGTAVQMKIPGCVDRCSLSSAINIYRDKTFDSQEDRQSVCNGGMRQSSVGMYVILFVLISFACPLNK